MSIPMKGLYNGQFANEQTLGTPAQIFNQEGVLRGLAITAQSTPSLNVDVSVGVAIVNGEDSFNRFTYFLDLVGQTLGFATPPSVGQSRNDLVVIIVTQINGLLSTVAIDKIQGTAAVTGTQVDPNLIETPDLFYLVLARVTVVGGSSVITSGQITFTASSKATHNNISAVSATVFPIRQIAFLDANNVQSGRFLELVGGAMTGKLQFTGTNHAGLRLNNLTTAQRNALTPQLGDQIYNIDSGVTETFSVAGWTGGLSQKQINATKIFAEQNF